MLTSYYSQHYFKFEFTAFDHHQTVGPITAEYLDMLIVELTTSCLLSQVFKLYHNYHPVLLHLIFVNFWAGIFKFKFKYLLPDNRKQARDKNIICLAEVLFHLIFTASCVGELFLYYSCYSTCLILYCHTKTQRTADKTRPGCV